MNYEKVYKKLYEKAKNRGKDKILENMENHHFVPQSLYYSKYKKKISKILDIDFKISKDQINIFPLTLKEHYLAHLILFKLFPDLKEIMFGLNQVMNRYGNSNDYISHKKKIYQLISENNKGYVSCFNLTNNEYERVTKEEFVSNSNLVGVNFNNKRFSKKYECKYCNKIITGYLNFIQHNTYYCKNQDIIKPSWQEKVKCSYCELEMNKNLISDHERSCKNNLDATHRIHTMTVSTCSYCGKEGATNAIKKHEIYHCEMNINRINAKQSLQKECQYCNKLFNSRGLGSHERKCSKLQNISK